MIPYSDEEWNSRLHHLGTVFTLTKYEDGEVKHFILENEEVLIKELQDDKPKL